MKFNSKYILNDVKTNRLKSVFCHFEFRVLVVSVLKLSKFNFVQRLAHLLVGDILDGLIVLTKRGNSIYSCGNLEDLHQVIS